jgi:predicted RNA-binding Zn ribbon-like protein
MTVSWIPHRFVGGVLALDTANTVVLRIDPQRTFDRFEDTAEIGRFAEAAALFAPLNSMAGGWMPRSHGRSRQWWWRSARRRTGC